MTSLRKTRLFVLTAALGLVLMSSGAALQQTAGELFEKALYVEEGQGDLQKAIGLYQDIVKKFPGDREIAAKALLHIGICYEKLGKTEARSAYNRLLRDYGDQLQLAKEARSRLAQLEAAASAPAGGQGGLSFRKLDVADAGQSHQARLSPDGSKFLYIGYQDKEPHYNLQVLDFASGKRVTLVEGINANSATLIFEWSPDGKKAAYVAGRGELRVVDVEGGKSELLWMSPEKETYVRPLDWSERNHSLLISLINNTENTVRLAALPEKGGAPRVIVSGHTDELGYGTGQFSPDGKLIVGMKRKEKNVDVYVWKTEGGDETRITTHAAEDTYPLWSPDGKHIVFMSDRAKTYDLWAIPMDGSRPAGEPARLQANVGKNKVPSDLTRSGFLTFYAMSSAGTPSDLFVLPVNPKTGEAAGAFLPFAKYPTQASRWSPDGSRIAYTSRKGNIQLPNAYVGAGGDSEELEIPARSYFINNIEWSRDGKSLLFPGWSNDDGLVGIFRISLDDQTIQPIHELGERYGANFKGAYVNLRWLPLAGRYMLFRLLSEAEEEAYLIDPEDYRIERVGDKFALSGFCIPSPDGRFLIGVNYGNKTITLISSPDGGSKVLMALPSSGFPAFSWSPDGKSFVWNEDRRLKIYSVLDGATRTLVEAGPDKKFGPGGLMSGTPNTAFSPDGTKIAYVLQDAADGPGRRSELWIVEATGDSPRKVADAPASHPLLGEVVWHPSGKTLFANGQTAESKRWYEHWVMENFLPGAHAARAGLAKITEPAPRKPNFRKIRTPFSIPQWSGSRLSPDGKTLAFGSGNAIWTVPIPGRVDPDLAGEPRELPGAADVLGDGLSWSGDGKWIAFSRAYSRDLRGGGTRINFRPEGAYIDVIPSSGGEPKRISVPQWVATKGGTSRQLSMSPDGKTVAFDSGGQIFVAAVDTGDIKQVTKDGGVAPSFSPDGTKIAYLTPPIRQDNPPARLSEVWVISAEGEDPVKVCGDLRENLNGPPTWSPDGRMIAFGRIVPKPNWRSEICIVLLSEKGRPVAPPVQIELPQFSRDFVTGWTPDNQMGLLLETPYHEYIYTVPVSGGKASQVSPLDGLAGIPRWSPDGERIFFRWKGGGLGSVPGDGGEVRVHTGFDRLRNESGYFTIYPGAGNSVSPDGKLLVISAGTATAGPNIYTIPVEGGEPKLITSGGRYPCWSPDGKWIAYLGPEIIGDEKPIATIFKIPAESGESQKITTESNHVTAAGLDWSPDGKTIAYFSKKADTPAGTLNLVPVAGGEAKEVCRVQDIRAHDDVSWSPDGQNIAFVSRGKIWVVPAEGGEPKEMKTDVDAHAGTLDWSPDGRKIVFSGEIGMDIEFWFMENFLPASKK